MKTWERFTRFGERVRAWWRQAIVYFLGFDYFISYAWKGRPRYAESLFNRLQLRGRICFLDKEDFQAGQDLSDATVRALKRSKALIVVATREIADSANVLKEIEIFHGLRSRRPVIPVDLDGTLKRVRDDHAAGRAPANTSTFLTAIAILLCPLLIQEQRHAPGRPSVHVIKEILRAHRFTRRIVWMKRILAATLGVFLVVAVLAVQAKVEAERKAKESRYRHYATQLNRVGSLWRQDSQGALNLLNDETSFPPRLRDFSWRYYYRLCDRLRGTMAGHTGSVNAVAYSPDGTMIASGGGDNLVILWDAASCRVLRRLAGHLARVNAVAFDPHRPVIASAGDDGAVRLWDVRDGSTVAVVGDGARPVNAVAFSPDGRWLAAGGDDNTVRIWDGTGGATWASFDEHTRAVNSLVFTLDGGTLISGSSDGTIKLWDLATKQCRATLDRAHLPVKALAVSGDGKWLASAGGDSAILNPIFTKKFHFQVGFWDLKTGQFRFGLDGHTDAVRSLAFARGGDTLVSASDDGSIILWDWENARVHATLTGHASTVNALAVSPDGGRLASGSLDKTVRLWELNVDEVRTVRTEHTEDINIVAVSGDGAMIATGSSDKTIKLWQADTGRRVTTLLGSMSYVTGLAFVPKVPLLVSSDLKGQLRVWDVSLRAARSAFDGPGGPSWGLTLSLDGSRVATLHDRTVLVRCTDMGATVSKFEASGGTVKVVVFAPDGRTLATAGEDGAVRLWDPARGTPLCTLDAHAGAIDTMAFTPDGRVLAAGGFDTVIRLWDVRSGYILATLRGHTKVITSLTVSPDGDTLASASYDQTIKLWDVLIGENRATFTGHTEAVRSIAFSPDGRFLVSAEGEIGGSFDKQLKIWESETGLRSGDRNKPGAALRARRRLPWLRPWFMRPRPRSTSSISGSGRSAP